MTDFYSLPRDPHDIVAEVAADTRVQTPLDWTPEQWAVLLDDEDDMFGFAAEALLTFAPFEAIKSQLEDEYVKGIESGEDEWDSLPLTRENVLAVAKDYCRFAWGNAMNGRDLSASRSITKLIAWMRLLREDEAVAELDDDANYNPYGMPALKLICERFGWPIPNEACFDPVDDEDDE